MKLIALAALLFTALLTTAATTKPEDMFAPNVKSDYVIWDIAHGQRAVMVRKGSDSNKILDELCKGVCSREYLGEFWVVGPLSADPKPE